MQDKKKERILNLLGVVFVLWGLVAVLYQFSIQEHYFVLWFCYIGLILIGTGILVRSDFLIASQLAIMGLPSLVWAIDFFYFLLTGDPLWGITTYFFEDQTKIGNLISLQHLFTVPLALFSLSMIKLKRKDFWVLSIVEVIVFYFISRIFSTLEQNINYVFSSSLPFKTPLPYVFDWFFFFFLCCHTLF